MAPKFESDPPMDAELATQPNNGPQGPDSGVNYKLQIFQSSLNLLAHTLIGVVVGVCLLFALRSFPLVATPLHIVLCVLGYQLLMAQAILSFSDDNGWSSRLKFIDRRRAHWILQLLGSAMAIAGSFVKIIDKTAHWTSLHGQFALVALVFTSVSLVNGLASLYAYEFRKVLPGNLSKLTHICTGTVAFVAACITLCYAFDKAAFRAWSTDNVAYGLIAAVGVFTFIVITNPVISMFRKTKVMIKNRSM